MKSVLHQHCAATIPQRIYAKIKQRSTSLVLYIHFFPALYSPFKHTLNPQTQHYPTMPIHTVKLFPQDLPPGLTFSEPMENHLYDLTTEEPRYTNATVPEYRPKATAHQIWLARRARKQYKAKCTKTACKELSGEIMQAILTDFWWQESDEDVYDYFVALQGDPFRKALPRPMLPLLCDCHNCREYTLTSSRVAYAGKNRGEWNGEEHMFVPYEMPPWYLHVPGVLHGFYRFIIEPRFSQSVLRALLREHDYQEWMTTEYECAVVGDALGIDAALVDLKLLGKEPKELGPNLVVHRKFDYGGITARSYEQEECRMSEDCLAALEQYHIDLYEADNQYFSKVCLDHFFETNAWTPAASVLLVKVFGQIKSEGIVPYEQQTEWQFNEGVFDIHLRNLVGYDVDLLSLPINARAATYYNNNPDPQAFVAKLVKVDISTVPAADMRCTHCWSNFDEADDEMIELKNGSVRTDNSPVKMPCPHGHIIGKTCLMQIVDAGDRLCPQCRVEIVRDVDPRRRHPGFGFDAIEHPPVDYSHWD